MQPINHVIIDPPVVTENLEASEAINLQSVISFPPIGNDQIADDSFIRHNQQRMNMKKLIKIERKITNELKSLYQKTALVGSYWCFLTAIVSAIELIIVAAAEEEIPTPNLTAAALIGACFTFVSLSFYFNKDIVIGRQNIKKVLNEADVTALVHSISEPMFSVRNLSCNSVLRKIATKRNTFYTELHGQLIANTYKTIIEKLHSSINHNSNAVKVTQSLVSLFIFGAIKQYHDSGFDYKFNLVLLAGNIYFNWAVGYMFGQNEGEFDLRKYLYKKEISLLVCLIGSAVFAIPSKEDIERKLLDRLDSVEISRFNFFYHQSLYSPRPQDFPILEIVQLRR